MLNERRTATQEERYQIYGLIKAGYNQKEISESIKRSPSSISRELSRKVIGLNKHIIWQSNAVSPLKKIKITPTVKALIDTLLVTLTPEKIAGRIKLETEFSLHHENIYRYIYQDKSDGGKLYKYLVRASKKYRKRYGTYDK